MSAKEAYDIFINFDPNKDPHIDVLDTPFGGEVFLFYTEDSKKLDKIRNYFEFKFKK